jgi:hypothetical protein
VGKEAAHVKEKLATGRGHAARVVRPVWTTRAGHTVDVTTRTTKW